MHRSWYWVLVILTGSFVLGSALQYYFTGEADRNTSTRNWLVVGQAILGVVVIGFGLIKQIQANRKPVEKSDAELFVKLTDD